MWKSRIQVHLKWIVSVYWNAKEGAWGRKLVSLEDPLVMLHPIFASLFISFQFGTYPVWIEVVSWSEDFKVRIAVHHLRFDFRFPLIVHHFLLQLEILSRKSWTWLSRIWEDRCMKWIISIFNLEHLESCDVFTFAYNNFVGLWLLEALCYLIALHYIASWEEGECHWHWKGAQIGLYSTFGRLAYSVIENCKSQ